MRGGCDLLLNTSLPRILSIPLFTSHNPSWCGLVSIQCSWVWGGVWFHLLYLAIVLGARHIVAILGTSI